MDFETPRLRDCESNKYPKSRVTKSRSQKVLQFNFEHLLKKNKTYEYE